MRLRYAFYSLLSLTLPTLAQEQTTTINSCQAPEPIQAAIRDARQIEKGPEAEGPEADEARQERQRRFKDLAARHPDDFWISRAYIDAMKYGVAPADVIAEFRARYEADSKSPAAAYLYARALTGKDTPKAIDLLTSTAESAPTFPWPFADLVTIYSSPNFRDPAKRNRYGEEFIGLCPASSEASAIATRLDKSDNLAAFAKTLRERIAGKTDQETIPLYRTLWTLEFKVTPLGEQAHLRERVAGDLRFLSGLDSQQFKSLESVLREGYKLTGNQQAEDALTSAAKKPDNKLHDFFDAQQAWMKANPFPHDDPESRKTYNEKRIRMLDEWIPQLPDEEFLRVERLEALAAIPGTADVVLIAEGEKALQASRKKKSGDVVSFTTAPIQVAGLWARKGLELERVPALVDEGLAQAAKSPRYSLGGMRSDLFDTPGTELMEENNRWHIDQSAWRTMAMAYTKMGKMDEARSVLAQWQKGLTQLQEHAAEIRKNRESEKSDGVLNRTRRMEDMILNAVRSAESGYATAMAEFALADKRKLDALAFYQSGLRAMGWGEGSRDVTKSEMARNANTIWKDLGGTQEGWQAWLDSMKEVPTAKVPEMSRWTAVNRELPELGLADQLGKTWTLAQLQGKTTLINVWATWCGPCREELPSLQKLFDKVRTREDVQVITFNMDDNIGLIAPFLAENKYTFPVLTAKSFLDNFGGAMGIPTNWISDRDGSIRLETTGFGGESEEWIKNTLEQMEKIRSGNVK